MSHNNSDFDLAGDILDTTVEELGRALANGAWSVRLGNDDLEVQADGWSLSVYASREARPNNWHFLVSGDLTGPLDHVANIVQSISRALETQGIVSNFEFSERDDSTVGGTIRHPNF